MRKIHRAALAGIAIVGALFISGCGTVGVQVWERDILSRPEMQLDHRAMDQSIDDHIYFSKEASNGGRGTGGGGCGCN